jgi:hypothetical protein
MHTSSFKLSFHSQNSFDNCNSYFIILQNPPTHVDIKTVVSLSH